MKVLGNNKKEISAKQNHGLNSKKELLRNLEKMVEKLERTFQASDIKDENLKMLLLKEIAECQLNLLNNSKSINSGLTKEDLSCSNLKPILKPDVKEKKIKSKLMAPKCFASGRKNRTNATTELTMNQIYDEWKIIALIMDRTCFFLYLSFLVISSGLFLYSLK